VTTTKTSSDDSAATLSALWDEHIKHEFGTRDTEATLETMVMDAYVNHVPVLRRNCPLQARRARRR
jgi:carboxymethylenebutenolidase